MKSELGVTVGTVSRGYAEATRRGLITDEVGRVTFVQTDAMNRPRDTPMEWPTSDRVGGNAINMATNAIPLAGQEQVFAEGLQEISADPQFAKHLIYRPNLGRADVREAAARWIGETTGLDIPSDQTFITSGTQNGLAVAFHLVAKPGDTVLVERLTYPGIKVTARTMQVRLSGVDMDEDGMIPESLDAAYRALHPRLIVCVPTIQNPLSSVMPDERRREIAEVADRHGVPILEDGIYGFLHDHQPAPIMRYTQTPVYFATGFSKAVSPALRTGFLIAPSSRNDDATGIMAAMSLHAPLLMTELAKRWINSGMVATFEKIVRDEACARQKIAKERLAGLEIQSHPAGFHVWVTLPEPWRSSDFSREAEKRGVIVTLYRSPYVFL